ncbi:MAG: uracil-DNA glycosylase family protein [Gemmatimonadota bacterium]
MRRFYASLKAPRVPAGIRVMNPYKDARAKKYTAAFLDKFFDDNRPRTLIFGINPGRFGAGITGITFTDPVALSDFCGIANHLPRRRELSSVFIYDVIGAMGGPRAFYGRFLLTAICPLGFTREDVNLNYYDVPSLKRAVTPFIVASIERHIALGGRRDRAIVLGNGQNAKYLRAINDEHRFFDTIDALEHPRFILQYRRKRVAEYVRKYVQALTGG